MGAVGSKVSGWGMDGFGAQAGFSQSSAQPYQNRGSLHFQAFSTTLGHLGSEVSSETVGGCCVRVEVSAGAAGVSSTSVGCGARGLNVQV